jgi:epoxyqueuosine reductase
VPRSSDRRAAPVAVPEDDGGLGAVLTALGREAGLAAVGIGAATVFEEARRVLFERKGRGLDGGMQFTYRNPERSTDPGRILAGARSLVVGAWSYRRGAEVGATGPAPSPRGEVARYARADHYASLRRALDPMAGHLRAAGWRATVVCDDNALVDRAAAHRAGLGWFGKNSLMLLPGQGSWVVLGSVVTDAPLRPTAPVDLPSHAGGCGTCTRCQDACPTGALAEAGSVDARRCLAWLVQAPGPFPVEFRRALGGRLYGCDECQRVCPINRVVDRKRPPPPAGADEAGWVDLLDLLDSSDDELLAAHGRWYIPGRDPRYLRRNALVALGNVGEGSDPSTERALRVWLQADDEMLVEHARWAARELGRHDLVGGPADRAARVP